MISLADSIKSRAALAAVEHCTAEERLPVNHGEPHGTLHTAARQQSGAAGLLGPGAAPQWSAVALWLVTTNKH